jgi:hypothetical protein
MKSRTKTKKTKKTTSKRKPKVLTLVYAEKRVTEGDPNVWPYFPELRYFGRYKGWKKLVQITREEYDRFIGNESLKVALERKQGGRRGAGEVPGAGHCWPMKCEALAVHPRQVERMNARNKRHGINVQYEPRHGLAIIPDEGEYRKLRKLHGVHHNNSYNG